MITRHTIAFAATGAASLLAISLLALGINIYDWGVALMFLAPLVIYGLVQMGRRLERWADRSQL